MHTSARRVLLAAVAGVVAGGFVLAAPASAHITVQADDPTPGNRARVVFRVPNEGETATTRVEVHLLPQGAPPIPSALTAPVAGWSAEVEYAPLDEPVPGAEGDLIEEAVSVITWTADGDESGIQPEEFGEFPVIMGPLPEVDQLFFPTFQTYAGLDEPVEWIERPDPDGDEPPNPAPVLELAAAGSEGEPDPEPAPESGGGSPAATGEADAVAVDDDGGDSLGRITIGIAIAGLAAGLAALVLGFVALRRNRPAG
jgi:uncharacterized protein YcnI